MTVQNACARCGAPLAPGARFCSRCGHDVSGIQGGQATERIATPPETPDPQAGLVDELRRATLGEYEIAGELGRGGMATVFLAHDISLDRKVAIKVMAPSLLSSGKGMADRFKREARTAAALSHPHILPIYAVRESGRLLFFIMKYVQGRGLDAIIKEHGALPIKMVQAILSQAGSALDYAHRHGIIHRDIKPANIMLDVEGWAVVTDFGIAKVTESQGLTMTGATIGTPTYMSPEQCAAKEITGATDQYSLGIAAYEMLTGHVPFDADSVMSLMWQHFHEPPPPIVDRRPDCPPELARAIERMLAKKAPDRWATLEEAVEAIGTPPLNDPVRQQMKALARGGTIADAAQRATPVSPVPKHAMTPEPRTGKPVTPPPPPVITSAPTTPIPPAPTTPIPATAAVPEPPALPSTPVEPISPTTPPEIAAAPTAIFAKRPPPHAPAPPPEPWAARKPGRRPSSGAMAAPGRPARTEPVPATPPPYATPRRINATRLIGIAVVLVVIGVAAWALFGRLKTETPTANTPAPAAAASVASVAVTPSPAAVAVGRTAQLTAVLKDGNGNLLSGRAVVWTSSDSTMARVSPTGLVTALAPGYINVLATSEGRSGTGTVMVTATAAPVASVDIPPATSVPLGDTAVLTAAPKDDHGNTLSGHTMTWSSSDRRIVAVSPSGTLSALRLGTAVITVAVEGKRATTRVSVTPPAVAIVVISPPTASLQIGGHLRLDVAARDAHDRPIAGRGVTWRSSDETIATVSAQGAVTALRAGHATITAQIESQSASAAVTVSAVPVVSVAVTPATLTLPIGKSAQLTVALRDTRGGALKDRDVTWSSSNPTVATVSATGSVTAAAGGSATITATSERVTGSATITVPAAPSPAPVAVTPTPTPPPPSESQPAPQPAPATEASSVRLPRRNVVAGGAHSCGITQSGAVVCWGNNATGQLGDAGAGTSASAPVIVNGASGFTTLVAGGDHTCGLSQGGSAVCWGLNTKGQLGNGRTAGPPAPSPVVGNHSFVALTAGARHTCGLGGDGSAWCWGDNGSGQLGDGSTRGTNTPRQVTGGVKFRTLAAGSDHTCGLATDGRVFCWGDGFSGQLGRGARESQSEPVPVDASVKFTALAAGGKHACAIAVGGRVYCWGANVAGEIGDGSKTERDRPVVVPGARAYTALSAGPEHTCALTDTGDTFCWGRNKDGQLGDGSKADRTAPVKVAIDQPLQSVSAGGTHTCGLSRSQAVMCWGGNARGQLGDGTITGRPSPAPVQAQ
jgi:serine/threonine protein kinase/alpha-tubulin suppressor-like RCC1 family protein